MNQSLTQAKVLWNKGLYREAARELVIFLFAVDSIGSLFSRAAIWFGISFAIIAGVNTFDKHEGEAAGLKTTLDSFLFFLVLGGVLIYLLFGFTPYVTTVSAGQ